MELSRLTDYLVLGGRDPCVSCVMFGVPVLRRGPRLGTSHGPHRASGQVSARPLCPGPTAWLTRGPAPKCAPSPHAKGLLWAEGVQCVVTSSPFGCPQGPGPAACTQSPPLEGPSSREDRSSSVTKGQRVTVVTFQCFPSRPTVRKCATAQHTCVLHVCTRATCAVTAANQIS